MKVWRPAEGDGAFNMTSMIDIVFLLITFFMTVTSYANAELIQVQMPIAPEAIVPEEVGDRQFISIADNGTYFLGAFKSDLETIKKALASVLHEQSWAALMSLGWELIISFFIGGALLTAIMTPLTYFFVKMLVNRFHDRRAARAKAK